MENTPSPDVGKIKPALALPCCLGLENGKGGSCPGELNRRTGFLLLQKEVLAGRRCGQGVLSIA